MRQILLMSLLLVGAGCQGLHDRLDCRRGYVDCSPQESAPKADKAPAKPQADAKPAPKQDLAEPARAAMAQEVLLVPRMVYVPFVAQAPTMPARLTPSMTVMPPHAPTPQRDEAVNPPVDEKTIKKLLEVCEKQCERIEHLEKCLRERNLCPPREPLLRRPLFPRCEPLFPRCEPVCEPLQQCEPISSSPPMRPAASTKQAPPVLIIE